MSEETMGNQRETTKKRSSLSFFKFFIFIVIVAAIVVAVYFAMKQGVGSGAVAVVNGQKITRAVYDERYAQLATNIALQGQSATTTEMQTLIKNQTLDNLVTEILLLQEADKEGIKVNEQEVNTLFSQNKSQFPDEAEFEKALTAQGFTVGTFKKFLIKDNIIRQYLVAHIDTNTATTTETEIKTLYDQAAASNPTVPPLNQIRDQVKNQIIQQKQQRLIADFIQRLRASSTVETLI
ncbi:MAG: hypothetical protein A3D52_01005 [Candidatus Taylorbacteria bacterium RIFCSPHIGHO2_02_FULL_44_36]|uniref:PpiC domain-containing protein n=1 Tax=Candidatus Taylorbacteria bacterium RIFCSPLOWO2_12_FULL_44_15c TaxID=1802333 RepID=A0A1G2P5Z8_9BACT|nr:MAG: hypothetical protein A3D52_01005 [Candidatus Taylorbacteria bacterium RIFCSPHIGHO2_02_FULL_44_36]OHA37927.1 MAG: hypothetical protein A3I97_00630 [Candidatus Taylorbacteria bacterium RIFCSPLOWO2_02_FULL_44_35]OHA43767.1 MAG: hypothetical protein A3G03_02055 [Candidatus Taylorbacteria bacterium RIFCSPLOWO2_12_FULL_44_15c]